jgi:hypothetical protein
MARKAKNMILPPVIAAYQQWITNCLIADGSLFSSANLWTPELVEEVRAAFVDHPDMGKKVSFWEKLKKQMENASPGAKHLMAEMIWALLAFPSNIKAHTKRNGIRDVWAYSGQVLSETLPLLNENVLVGIGSGGQGYLTGYWRELTFIIKLTVDLKKKSQSERQQLFSSYDDLVAWIAELPEGKVRQFRHMLRYVAFPDRVERIASNRDRLAILEEFGIGPKKETVKWSDRQVDDELAKLRAKLETEYPGEILDFYESPLKPKWKSEEDSEPLDPVEPPDEKNPNKIWKFAKWMGPLVAALRELGGTASIKVVYKRIQDDLKLTKDFLAEKMPGSDQTRFYNEVAWARQYLFWEGLMESPKRGIWALTAKAEGIVIDEQKAQNIAEKWAKKQKNEIQKKLASGDASKPLELNDKQIASEYPLSKIAEDAGVNILILQRWVAAIHRKGQAIFYGPPGTGKTFLAQKLAQHLVGGGNGICELVQFHPAYSYEDFMQGLRPQRVNGGLDYPLVPGRFMDFCDRAQKRTGICVLIIDEINRANLARVFGELMYLLEYRKSDTDGIPLAGGGRFHIPANVRLIGTMNTADRSIALVDYALRRRFAFLGLAPDFEVLRRFHEREQTGFPVDGLIKLLEQLNNAINDPHYSLGISFFMQKNLAKDLPDIWSTEVEPFLEEHFFDQREKFDLFRWEKIAAHLAL